MNKLPVIVVLGLSSSLAIAQGTSSFQCTLGDQTRRVEIYSEPGVTVPCEVHYYKDTEMPGERQVLWRAENEAGYCEARAREFVAQLEGMGWSCSEGAGMPAEEGMESDDTDALAPAEDDIEIPESDEPQ